MPRLHRCDTRRDATIFYRRVSQCPVGRMQPRAIGHRQLLVPRWCLRWAKLWALNPVTGNLYTTACRLFALVFRKLDTGAARRGRNALTPGRAAGSSDGEWSAHLHAARRIRRNCSRHTAGAAAPFLGDELASRRAACVRSGKRRTIGCAGVHLSMATMRAARDNDRCDRSSDASHRSGDLVRLITTSTFVPGRSRMSCSYCVKPSPPRPQKTSC